MSPPTRKGEGCRGQTSCGVGWSATDEAEKVDWKTEGAGDPEAELLLLSSPCCHAGSHVLLRNGVAGDDEQVPGVSQRGEVVVGQSDEGSSGMGRGSEGDEEHRR